MRSHLRDGTLARVGAFIAARLAPQERVRVALSGGCDSVVLAHVLCRLGLSGRLDAIHIHHGLSPNADAWAAFCADYCRELGILLHIRHVDVALDAGDGLEAAARKARYAAFAEQPDACLALAQHRGDQAETVILNLLRGAGVLGAAAMLPEHRRGPLRLLRPLLSETRADIETYAENNGLRWITDESNDDTALNRNFLRHRALPLIRERFPAAESALAQAARHFSEAAGLLDDLAALDWERAADGDAARLLALRALSPARLKNLLRYRLRRLGWQLPVAARLDEFARQLQSAGPDRHPELRLPEGRMHASRGRLYWLGKG